MYRHEIIDSTNSGMINKIKTILGLSGLGKSLAMLMKSSLKMLAIRFLSEIYMYSLFSSNTKLLACPRLE